MHPILKEVHDLRRIIDNADRCALLAAEILVSDFERIFKHAPRLDVHLNELHGAILARRCELLANELKATN